MNINATAVDWGVVVLALTTSATVFVKFMLPAIISIKKGSNGNGHAFELGRMEQILEGRTSFFDAMVSDTRRIAEEQGKIALLLDNVHRLVSQLEERSRGQDGAIQAILSDATIRNAERERVRRRRGK